MSDYAFFEATKIFKRAVPLMVKYKVPTTPHYFSLWYTYCSGNNPPLTSAIDDIVKRHGRCSPDHCDKLIKTHLIDDAAKELESFRQQLETVVADLGQSLEGTLTDTEEFHDVLQLAFTKLENAAGEGTSDSEKLIMELLQGSHRMLETTSKFNLQMRAQQDEICALKAMLESTQQDALNDVLTETLNRRAFDKDLATLVSGSTSFGIIMVDIDHFKAFNDEFGHLLGDQVLKIVASKLKQSAKDKAKVYRFGGEEFTVLAPDSSPKNTEALAEKMRASLEKLSLTDKRTGNKINTITASFGVTTYQAGDTSDALVERSDNALYQAKKNGRNCVESK